MEHALRVLEFGTVLERLVSQCETEMAAAEAAALRPAFERDQVWYELDRTREAYNLIAGSTPPTLRPVRDLRQAIIRASKGGVLGGLELFQIGDALAAMRAFRNFIAQRKSDFPHLVALAEVLPDLKRLEDQLNFSIDVNGDVLDGASSKLAEIRKKKNSMTQRIMDKIQSYISGRTRELLSDPIYTVRDGRYVIPVKSENRGKIRGIVHDTSSSGQTVYIEPEGVLQMGNAMRELEAAEREEVQRILRDLSEKVGGASKESLPGFEAAAELDLLLAKAKLAFDMKASMPYKSDGHGLNIEGGRHPLIDQNIVVPLDIRVGFDKPGLLITGPNTGGKTVAIKAVGLFALMAQTGLMLPARQVYLGPFTQVWADIGDEQSLQQSLSTFSGHIKNIANALNNLKAGALVLFDEIGAGTDPAEGAALAKAILRTMRDAGAIVLASTHYGELKAFAYDDEGFDNAAMEFDAKTLKPTYRLIMGAPGASHALKIAERYGIPKKVVEQAVTGLGSQQQEIGQMLERLEQAQRQARIAQSEADKRAAELKRSEERAATKLAEAEEIRKTAHSRASAIIEDALREIRLEAASLFEELKGAVDQKAQEKMRGRLKELQEVGQSFADEFKQSAPMQPKKPSTDLKKGMSVKIDGYTQVGTILADPKGESVQVQMGALKLSVPVSKVKPTQAEKPAARKNIGLQKAQTATRELHLRAMRADDAMETLERFLDEAILAGLDQVRIVHGKGEGILRKLTQDYLRRHPDVATYREGEPGEGGQGATIAVLK